MMVVGRVFVLRGLGGSLSIREMDYLLNCRAHGLGRVMRQARSNKEEQTMDDQIGWLVYVDRKDQEGFAAMCDKCVTKRNMIIPSEGWKSASEIPVDGITVRTMLFEVNVYPYKQCCFTCGNTLQCGQTEAWPELFTPKVK